MAPQPKGKQATKGAKQIVEENKATLSFYRNMALGANGVTIIVLVVFFDIFTFWNILLLITAAAAYIASYQFMLYMAKPNYSDSGQLLDSGVDLNMEGGIAEHVKDLIILTSGCQLLSLISNYFWLLWLLAPIRGFWILWVNVLGPYFFQKPEAEPEVNEKKQKKLERKMKRQRQ